MRKKLLFILTLLLALPIGMLAQGTTWQSATEIKSGETKEGSLYSFENSKREDEWYKIVVPEEGTAEFTLTPGGNLNIHWIRLYRVENGELKDRNFSYMGTEEKTVSITDIGKGTYYLQVHRYDGGTSYTLKYQFTPCPLGNDPEPNDEWSQGSLLESGKTIDCRLGYEDGTGLRDNDDWFKFEVPEEGKIDLTFDPTQGIGLNIHWISICRVENGQLVERNFSYIGTAEKTVTITDLGIGTFYMRVHRYSGHGGYKLKYVYTRVDFVGDEEPNDEWSEDCALLKSGETIECKLGYQDANGVTDNDDWFKIEVSEEGKGEFMFNPNQENGLNIHWMALHRVEDGKTIQRNHSYLGTEEKTVPITDLGIGTYYLQVHRYSGHGGYTLNYQFTPNPYIGDEEPNNDYENAQQLIKGEKVMAHIGYTDDKGVTDNDDWYKFDVDIIGIPSLTIVPNQTYDLNIHWIQVYSLQDGELKELKLNYIGKNQASIYLPYYEKGTYYVQVRRYSGHGGYTLLYDEEPIRYYDDEPNDEVSQAVIIHDGETKVGNIGFRKDEETYDINDWFKVTVDEGSQLMFSYDPDQGEGIDATLYLWYDNGGTMEPVTVKYNQGSLKEGTSAWAHLQSLNIFTDENMKGGTYYLDLHRNSGMGTYTMTFSTVRRTLGSNVRVHYIGWPSVRRGVPGSFEVTVENTGATPAARRWQ